MTGAKRTRVVGEIGGGPFVMPPKQPNDEDPGVRVIGDQHLVIYCGQQHITVSAYNAARIVGLLCLFLNIKLSKATGKRLVITPKRVQP